MLLERVCDGDQSDARQKRAIDLSNGLWTMTRQEARPQRGSLFR